MLERLKTLSIKGLVWSAGESFGVAVLSLGVFTLLARILEPEDFGVVALAGAFVLTFNLIVGHSFADALVQRTTLEPGHVDTAFWANLGIALLLAGGCHAGAGTAAAWLGEPMLADILPWLAWVLPLNAIGVVQTGLFRREVRFRAIAVRSLTGRSVGAAVGVAMALAGFGAWSLVAQQLAGSAVTAVAIAAASPWRPRLSFSASHLRVLWRFGFNVSASQLINGVGEQALVLIVGSMFGSVILGYFSIAWRIVQLIRSLISSAVYHVGFNAFSRLQEDRAAVVQAFLQATRLSCLFGFPIGAGMALLSEPLITVAFGAKWSHSVPLLAVLAIEMFPAFYAMFFSACYRAMGNAGWVLGLSALYVASGLAAVVALSPLGVGAIAAAWVAKSIVLLPVQIALLRRMLAVTARQLVQPVLTPLAASTIMAVVLLVLLATIGVGQTMTTTLISGISIGAVIYCLAIFVISPDLLRFAARTTRVMMTPGRALKS